MNRLNAALLLSLIPVAAVAQDKPSTYALHLEIAGNVRDFNCTFTQTGKDLSGSCEKFSGFGGTADADSFNWHVKGEQATLNFVGKRGPDGNIKGTVTAVEYSVDGDFTATLQK